MKMMGDKCLCMVGMRFVLVMLFVMAGSARAASTGGMGPCQNLKSKAEVRVLLQQWRDLITPMLVQKERERVEKYAYSFPIDQSSNAMPITFSYSEDKKDMNIRPIINRRDWAYAFEGFRYTFKGGVYEGLGRMVDMGFWCFLQASLLKMEPDHLANVGFHLNNRGAFDDAASVLCYARSLNVDHPGIHNNLAHTQASLGNFYGALAEQSIAIALDPYMSRYRDKMKTYGNLAGLSLNSAESVHEISSPSTAFAEAWSAIIKEIANYNVQHAITMTGAYTGSGGYISLKKSVQRKVMNSQAELWQCSSDCGDERLNPGCNCNCSIKHMRTSYYASMEWVCGLVLWIDENERFRRKELIASKGRMIMILEEHRREMRPDEIRAIYERINNWYLNWQFGDDLRLQSLQSDVKISLMAAKKKYEDLKVTMEQCNKRIRDEMPPIDPADYFGRRPGTLVLKILHPESNNIWKLWFVVGSLDLHPDGQANLSLGIKGALSGKLMYNFETNDFGSGIAVGLNLGKALGPFGEGLFKNTMKFEFVAEVDSAKGPRWGIETGISPRLGVLHTDQKMVIRLEN